MKGESPAKLHRLELLEQLAAVVAVMHGPAQRGSKRRAQLGIVLVAVGALGILQKIEVEHHLAVARATGRNLDDPGQLLNGLNALGQPLWQPSGPNGFGDTVDTWASAEGMKLRLDVASNLARQVKDLGNPLDVLEGVAGAAASSLTREAIARAESKQQGFAILLMSPEFQRR